MRRTDRDPTVRFARTQSPLGRSGVALRGRNIAVLGGWAGAFLLGVCVALAVWGFWLEPASLVDHEYSLELPGWPAECDDFRIAVLADLHIGSPHNGLDKLDQIVSLTQSAAPDLILLAGDYVIHGVLGGQFQPPEAAAEILSQLTAPSGVYAVLGNHDWWYDFARVRGALEDVSIPVLEDRAAPVTSGGCHFWLVGVSDFMEGAHDIRAALRVVPKGSPTILFTHNPDLFPEVPDRVTLTIAGHTHGGQVYLPGLGRLVVPSNYGERFAIGHIAERGRHLFVSPGVGTSMLPVRFLVPPEVSVLRLRAATR